LTNGIAEMKSYAVGNGNLHSHPLGASYPPTTIQPMITTESKVTATTSSKPSITYSLGKGHPIGTSSSSSSSSSSSLPSKSSLSSTLKDRIEASISRNSGSSGGGSSSVGGPSSSGSKGLSAAQKKAEQLSNKLSMSGLLGAAVSSLPKPTSSSFVDVTSGGSTSSSSFLPPASKIPSQHPSSSASSTSNTKPVSLLHSNVRPNAPKPGRSRGQKSLSSSMSASSATSPNTNPGMGGPYPEPALDWVPDPNEPTYCLCNQVSYGEMVGCDNASCPIEWFHYGCVGLTDAPRGKWYCPDCAQQIKKRRVR